TLFVITGPSGAGKGTVLAKVFEQTDELFFSVSATTRKPREGETDGKNYFFITKKDFKEMIRNGKLLEYTQYAGNYYGTPKDPIDEALAKGKDALLEIELEGAMNIKRLFPDAVLIFLSPPSLEELEKRLRARGTEDEEHIRMRLDKARIECEASDRFDFVVINDIVQDAADKINKIIINNRKSEE
ncbi:MAG: guanylate kinase, partial [Clostridia bacterium]|nr:guanylate kinase [Clostridia bacterium]